MGQAKQRGTFEERKALAIKRDKDKPMGLSGYNLYYADHEYAKELAENLGLDENTFIHQTKR